jgi:RNA ligase (TIGR02306 family)
MSNTTYSEDYIKNNFVKPENVTIPEKPMVTVEKIVSIDTIPGADLILSAGVLGWNVVVAKKDDFKVGDLCVYAVIDTVFPKHFTQTSFLENKPLKTKKIRKVISQGLIIPLIHLADLNINLEDLKEGQDLTQIIGCMKYVSTEEINVYSPVNKLNRFPIDLVPKTDEPRLQNIVSVLEDIKSDDIYVTRKEDGTSATYIFHNDTFMMCSRNLIITVNDQSTKHYYHIAEKFNIENVLRNYGKNIAVQGEIVGPGINGNRLKLNELDFRVFNIYDIDAQKYTPSSDMFNICKELNFNNVPLLYSGPVDNRFQSVKSCLDYADSLNYSETNPIEGIVIRNDSHTISFKVISNRYLLKNDL